MQIYVNYLKFRRMPPVKYMPFCTCSGETAISWQRRLPALAQSPNRLLNLYSPVTPRSANPGTDHVSADCSVRPVQTIPAKILEFQL